VIVSAPREKLWAVMNEKLSIPWSNDFQAIGLVIDDCLCAVTGYNSFLHGTCMMHVVVIDPAKITREFVRESFRYPFKKAGVLHVLSMVAERNTKAVSLNLKLGFRILFSLPDRSSRGDLLGLTMSAAECRWIRS
jgi:hypothetical protein